MTLPANYLIPPAPESEPVFLESLEKNLQSGAKLMQFRAKGMSEEAYLQLAQKVVALAHSYGCKVLLNADPALVVRTGADGVHLDSKRLAATDSRPLADQYLVAASGHTLAALKKAEQVGASFGVLSPVKYTSAHPDIEPLGWEGFAEIIQQLSIPVYALGGVSKADEADAVQAGGQGVAGAKGYWAP